MVEHNQPKLAETNSFFQNLHQPSIAGNPAGSVHDVVLVLKKNQLNKMSSGTDDEQKRAMNGIEDIHEDPEIAVRSNTKTKRTSWIEPISRV